VLECHSSVFCFDELDSYRVLASSSFETPISEPLVGFKIPRWAEQLDSPVLRDLGLPHEAQQIYHGQKILFLVRDYRDSISSMLKLRGQTSWLQEWAEPIINAQLAHNGEFARRWSRELALSRTALNRLIGIGALYWTYKNASLLRYKEQGFPVLPICYERLVTRPEEELRRICTFLEIEFSDNLLNHSSQAHRETFQNGLTVGNTNPNRSIDATSVGQWPSFLEAQDITLAQEIVGTLPSTIATYLRNL